MEGGVLIVLAKGLLEISPTLQLCAVLNPLTLREGAGQVIKTDRVQLLCVQLHVSAIVLEVMPHRRYLVVFTILQLVVALLLVRSTS